MKNQMIKEIDYLSEILENNEPAMECIQSLADNIGRIVWENEVLKKRYNEMMDTIVNVVNDGKCKMTEFF